MPNDTYSGRLVHNTISSADLVVLEKGKKIPENEDIPSRCREEQHKARLRELEEEVNWEGEEVPLKIKRRLVDTSEQFP